MKRGSAADTTAPDSPSSTAAGDVAGQLRLLLPSRGAPADASSEAFADASSGAGSDTLATPERDACPWCGAPLDSPRKRWCSKRCRQTAWRARQLAVVEDLGDAPKRLAYADPPYPGTARKYYSDQPNYAGEVDHAALASLLQEYDGWALSTSAVALREVLPLLPPEARVAAWVKPNGVSSRTRGPHNTWEPLIYLPARRRRPGFRDWVSAKPARGGGDLPGRKPIAFCAWLFQLLGASPSVDTLDDLFPGTGIVSAHFRALQEEGKP